MRKTSKKVAGGTATGNFLKLSVADDKGKVEKVTVEISVIDGKGGYLIPGIIDSHQHIMLSKGTGPDDIINKQLPYTPAYNAIPQAAIEVAGIEDSAAIVTALAATDKDGVTGHVTFDGNGDPQKSVSMIQVVDGAYTLHSKVTP